MKKILTGFAATIMMLSVCAQHTKTDSSPYPLPVHFSSQQNQESMLTRLHIRTLRPGPSGDEKAPDHANYDSKKANPCR